MVGEEASKSGSSKKKSCDESKIIEEFKKYAGNSILAFWFIKYFNSHQQHVDTVPTVDAEAPDMINMEGVLAFCADLDIDGETVSRCNFNLPPSL